MTNYYKKQFISICQNHSISELVEMQNTPNGYETIWSKAAMAAVISRKQSRFA